MILEFMAKRKPSSRSGRRAGEAMARPWLFGTHAVVAALANPQRRCRRLLVTREAEPGLRARFAAAHAARPTLEIRDRRDIERVLPKDAVHQGVALLADPLPAVSLDSVLAGLAPGGGAVVCLDRATDPRNVGAVLRSAAAFGAAAVVQPAHHAPAATGALAKAASGALEIVPLVRVVNLARALRTLKEACFRCVGLEPDADRTLGAAKFDDRVALVLGSEGGGLRRLTREACDLRVRVPVSAEVQSLNLSATAAIALYELSRRRR